MMKKALDEQVRVKQAAMLKERAQEREWVQKEQARISIWNEEERKKIEEEKKKYAVIRQQREQQEERLLRHSVQLVQLECRALFLAHDSNHRHFRRFAFAPNNGG